MDRDGFLRLKRLKMKDLNSCVVVFSIACPHSSVYVSSVSYYDCFDRRAKRLFLSLKCFGHSLSDGSTCRCLSNAVCCCFWCRVAVVFFLLVSRSQNTCPHTPHTPTPHRHAHIESGTITFSVCLMAAYRGTQRETLFLGVMHACWDFWDVACDRSSVSMEFISQSQYWNTDIFYCGSE